MKVILLEDVRKVGKKGDIVKVADGYGQNYLIKNHLAVMATEAERKVLAQEKAEEAAQEALKKEEAEALAKRLEDITVEFKVATGKEGRTFEHISTKQIVKALREQYDIKVDKRKFINAYPIGNLGTTKLKIELFKGVIGTINVHLSEK